MRTEINNMALPRPHIPNNLCHVFCFQVSLPNKKKNNSIQFRKKLKFNFKKAYLDDKNKDQMVNNFVSNSYQIIYSFFTNIRLDNLLIT